MTLKKKFQIRQVVFLTDSQEETAMRHRSGMHTQTFRVQEPLSSLSEAPSPTAYAEEKQTREPYM